MSRCLCRTLTPFGFQAEERTLWQAPETYALMSPFNQADKIKKPLLLIHGEADNNTGDRPCRDLQCRVPATATARRMISSRPCPSHSAMLSYVL